MTVDHDPTRAPASAADGWLMEHGDALYAYARSRVRDPNVAEDLVQETLLAGLASGLPLGKAAERSWLMGTLKHKLVDHLRSTVRERPLNGPESDGLADLFDRSGHWKAMPSKWSANPRDWAESAEFRDVLAQC